MYNIQYTYPTNTRSLQIVDLSVPYEITDQLKYPNIPIDGPNHRYSDIMILNMHLSTCNTNLIYS